MFIVSANGNRALRQVHVSSVYDETDEQVLKFAMDSQNENKSSLFGWTVHRYPETPTSVIVDLWRD